MTEDQADEMIALLRRIATGQERLIAMHRARDTAAAPRALRADWPTAAAAAAALGSADDKIDGEKASESA